jgi:hypothetical protein
MREEEYLEPKSQDQFEQHMRSLMERKELYFPRGIVYPERELSESIPVKKPVAGRLATFLNQAGAFFLKPVLAYMLVLCLIYPAYRGLFLKPQVITEIVKVKEPVEVPKRIDAIGTTQEVRWTASNTRAGEAEKEIVLSKGETYITLSFFVAIQTDPNLRYDAEIRDEQGSLVAEQKGITSRDRLGNFSLVCSKQLFKEDGHYVLNVLKVNTATSATEPGPHFRFKIVHSAR